MNGYIPDIEGVSEVELDAEAAVVCDSDGTATPFGWPAPFS
jgi:hypothetical protein